MIVQYDENKHSCELEGQLFSLLSFIISTLPLTSATSLVPQPDGKGKCHLHLFGPLPPPRPVLKATLR